MGVGEGGSLGDDIVGGGLVVGRSGGDVDILSGTSAEKADVALHLRGQEADELADGVELLVAQEAQHLVGVVDVDDDLTDIGRYLVLMGAAVDEPQVVASGGKLTGDGTGDGAGATD